MKLKMKNCFKVKNMGKFILKPEGFEFSGNIINCPFIVLGEEDDKLIIGLADKNKIIIAKHEITKKELVEFSNLLLKYT